MFVANKIKSRVKPQKLVSLNNGVWYYNYDIVENTLQDITKTGEEIELKWYEFLQVRILGTPTVDKCVEAVLKEYKDESDGSLYVIRNISNDSNIKDLVDDIYFNVKVDFGVEQPLTELEKAKRDKIKLIDEYDTSAEVNSFYLNGLQVWLNKDTRVGLMNSLTIEKNAGKEESTLWFNSICITINCDAAIQMLSALELYALNCYNVTAEHKVAVEGLTTLEQALNYDYTIGYPDKLSFTI